MATFKWFLKNISKHIVLCTVTVDEFNASKLDKTAGTYAQNDYAATLAHGIQYASSVFEGMNHLQSVESKLLKIFSDASSRTLLRRPKAIKLAKKRNNEALEVDEGMETALLAWRTDHVAGAIAFISTARKLAKRQAKFSKS